MQISVVIPVLNEEDRIENLVASLLQNNHRYVGEVIVVDGGSSDNTIEEAEKAGAHVIHSVKKGRAVQMNAGAEVANGDVLYFLHADTYPPRNFDLLVHNAIQMGNAAGCFRLKFDMDHPLLNFYGWCTRFRFDIFRFGDQSLFITRNAFDELAGFDDKLMLMEDFDIIKRLKRRFSFRIIESPVVTSARRYQKNGTLKLQVIFIAIFTLYHLGVPQKQLKKLYNRLVKD